MSYNYETDRDFVFKALCLGLMMEADSSSGSRPNLPTLIDNLEKMANGLLNGDEEKAAGIISDLQSRYENTEKTEGLSGVSVGTGVFSDSQFYTSDVGVWFRGGVHASRPVWGAYAFLSALITSDGEDKANVEMFYSGDQIITELIGKVCQTIADTSETDSRDELVSGLKAVDASAREYLGLPPHPLSVS